ncbi:N-acetylmuramoyl-L-alanine amidase [uncultured Litoreibacter sp.]|uniref:N-acetylmuramoyl-L-alanine amidase n=1 Tax=uncultured Litoreibacter sp. TaxID=1392394 RepID=UPI0026063E41|nr:N-acetylmuramoyl-L-alanine amidase [uncultured Litoreibacter sp.]
MYRKLIAACCALSLAVGAGASVAQQLRALARVDMENSAITDNGLGVEVALALTQAVPYRVFTLDAPMRLVIDFREVAFEANLDVLDQSDLVASVAGGAFRPGWSRLVMELSGPLAVQKAALETDLNEGDAVVRVVLAPATPEEFAASAGAPGEDSAPMTEPVQRDDGKLIVALDPGHGGVDPGAQRGGHDEADLMLQFARELKEALLRGEVDEVVMTRTDDSFVSLPARVSLARAGNADLFISLHADALVEGRATGTTIYTLSEEASDRASALLAERQDRQDILAGVDLRAQDDQIATVLMDLARLETAPRADMLADQLVIGMRERLGSLHKRPRLKAGFSVLKAPDIPSVLIELGFMSSQSDLDNLMDPVWRAQAAEGIVDAIGAWAVEEEAQRSRAGQ